MVWDAVGRALGSEVRAERGLGGGDINAAFAVTLADGREVFVKTNRDAPEAMFEAEARGLAWLSETGALRIPAVLAATPQFLALELIETSRRVTDFDDRLGRGLAALHRHTAPRFGLDHDNFIGRLPQRNDFADDWAEFYRRERLEPQLAMATDRGLSTATMRRQMEALFTVLADRVGRAEAPARLHGDLWGGNLHVDEAGLPCLIDPAVYAGHREVDLSMMRLFGGFGPRVFAAYEEAFPLAPGHEERVALYQLYPLLVHVNLFGGGYVGSVESTLRALV
jgi:fructosamine-3-kinase